MLVNLPSGSKHQTVAFDDLASSDLIIDATYQGGCAGNAGDDPINRLLACGNQGGFRVQGKATGGGYRLVVLYSVMNDPDWPDYLDVYSGLFHYFGDNKRPGHALHDTPRKGNELLRQCFDAIHSAPPSRHQVPPFFVFTKAESGRDVLFRGLAVPGAENVNSTDDLVAVWRTSGDRRFQNYRSTFTILDVPVVTREWLTEVKAGNPLGRACPPCWKRWADSGIYTPLRAPRSVVYRTKEQQSPTTPLGRDLVRCIYDYFKDDPYGFERCAAEIACLLDPNITEYDLTRQWMDGGRDALGKYRIGRKGNEVVVDFALEAKCYQPTSGVGVKNTSRLISRLRHRQFGIFVTTSYVSLQAYREITEDAHPVIIISGSDIARILTDAGLGTKDRVRQWLVTRFPARA